MTTRRAATVALPTFFLLLTAAPAPAQDVRADVQVHTGPVHGRIIIGGDRHRDDRRERVVVIDRVPRRGERIVVERRNTRRVTIVEDFRAKTQRSHARHDNRHVGAWWDPRSDQYGFQRWRSGLERVVLCEHGDKFYVLGGRYERYDDDRYDDGRYDDNRNRGRRRDWN